MQSNFPKTKSAYFHSEQLQAGALACMPVLPSIFIFGAVLGVLAQSRDISLAELIFMSVTVFAGSSQFIAIDLWRDGIPALAILASTAIVNSRYILIGTSLRPVFNTSPFWVKLCGMYLVADENWALTMARDKLETPGFLLGGGIALGLIWIMGNITGFLLGGGIPDPKIFGLDFAFTSVFCALSVSIWKGRHDIVPWIAAACASAISHYLISGSWSILIGALVGAIASLSSYQRSRPNRPTPTSPAGPEKI